MRYLTLSLVALLNVLTACANPITGTIPTSSWSVEIEDVVTIPDSLGQKPRLEDLVFGGAPGLAYVLDQSGPIYTFDPASPNPTPALFFNLYSVVNNANLGPQTGLRGMAFHPDFNTPGAAGYRTFYTSHSRNAFSAAPAGQIAPKFFNSPPNLNHDSALGEWRVDAAGAVIPGSYRELIRVGQPFDDHNIGQIGFNPNAQPGDADYGNLYVALGDGGGVGDPNGLAQNLSTSASGSSGKGFPHGSILRINPIAAGSDPFQIPADNPFVGQPSTIQEVWAYGLRNPHKFVWDTAAEHKMLISDIGQGKVEEINLGAAGANYGWDLREGTFTFISNGAVGALPGSHPTDPYTYPVAQYDHDLDNNGFNDHLFAVVGGPVYRGDAIPELRGRYFFGDFSEESVLWSVNIDELVQRDDFTNLASLEGGHLAPFEQVRLTRNGTPTTLLDLIRSGSGNPGLNRTDIRLEEGPDGELYVLNKRDGVIRRFASTTGLLAGDFNQDGQVDAADYTVWRDLLGVRYEQRDYDVWAAAYGQSLPGLSATVPEPSAGVIGLLGCAVAAGFRRTASAG
ncbi:PQQ-dependent sugar dehydrogenase [Botrimarina hoheduenensis]|uniref:Soluble aldose sugar dehydrogenase YliI n=1 Tax=Botrimarina hoheduenensis TaxID=2528000 RepID=A0A5C5W9Q5_9BACT|nr:PQQ-dependent sugar dehydrogenase [Botrimarina hoheduenensis]TWT47227.1 Soluble aldose sugar dehydrogenase YliI precursor [Botrimarina hoheduenensis]